MATLILQVVAHERPDLQAQAAELVRQLGEYTITLKELEDNLLARLANSQVSMFLSSSLGSWVGTSGGNIRL